MSENNYPPLTEQGKNLAAFSWELLKKAITDGGLLVSDEVREKRMKICKNCEKYDSENNRCFECGCLLEFKAKYALDSCPLKKWNESNEHWINGKFDEIVEKINEDNET